MSAGWSCTRWFPASVEVDESKVCGDALSLMFSSLVDICTLNFERVRNARGLDIKEGAGQGQNYVRHNRGGDKRRQRITMCGVLCDLIKTDFSLS